MSEGCVARPGAGIKLAMDSPIRFEPLYQERVWGGRWMERLPGRRLPGDAPYGESWELVDRADAQSVVRGGIWAGRTLGDLWSRERWRVFGGAPGPERFPLLIKILDAEETLSVQVHPPADIAPELGGEPKTEMWYLLDALPDAALYAGLRRGVGRDAFAAALAAGTVEQTLHRIGVRAGDAMFIPSGRVHAIGAGCRILEVQQNSDTTYRVFDWNRTGLDGKPRALHIEESMRCIDFADPEPALAAPGADGTVVECPLFRVERLSVRDPVEFLRDAPWAVGFVVAGALRWGTESFERGETFLVPAGAAGGRCEAESAGGAEVLRITG
jgi:mannose-6-phosphate isomerase